MNTFKAQIVMLCVSLVIMTALSIQFSSWWLSKEFNERQIDSLVNRAERSLKTYLEVKERSLISSANVLVGDFGFKRALSTDDKLTIESMLENHGHRLGADLMAVISGENEISALYGINESYKDYLVSAGEEIRKDPLTGLFTLMDRKVYRLIQVPIKAPNVIGFLLIGFEMNQPMLVSIKENVEIDLTFYSRSAEFIHSTIVGMSVKNAKLFERSMSAVDSRKWGFKEYETRNIPIKTMNIDGLSLMAHADLAPLNSDFEKLTYSVLFVTFMVVVVASFGSNRISERLTDPLSKMHKELVFRANYDNLTGLLNRGAAIEMLSNEVRRAQRDKKSYCLALCDLDLFKRVNDTYGHSVGDEVLREYSRRLKKAMREFDVLGRYGGEEFILGLAQDKAAVEKTLNRLRQLVGQQTFNTEAGEITVTMSCGCYVITPEENIVSLSYVIERADKALYEAKHRGRNQVVLTDMIKELTFAMSQQLHIDGNIDYDSENV